MFDKYTQPLLKSAFITTAKFVIKTGINANQISVVGFFIGLVAVFSKANHDYIFSAVSIVLSRIFDGLDGTVARLTQATEQGGYLDKLLKISNCLKPHPYWR